MRGGLLTLGSGSGEAGPSDSDPPLELRIHARARRLRLTIGPRGAKLSAPPGVPEAVLRDFVAQHREWLRRHWAALAARRAPGPLRLDGSQSLRLRGLELRLVGEASGLPRVVVENATLRVNGHGDCPRRAARLLLQWLAAQLDRDVQRFVQRHAPVLGWPRRVRIRPLKSLWGSLAVDGSMSLDLALVGAPPEVLEYLVVHELAHLRERHHGPGFWARVEAVLPNWRAQRRWLREHGQALKADLAGLRG